MTVGSVSQAAPRPPARSEPTDEEVSATLTVIAVTGQAQCALCGKTVIGASVAEVLDNLTTHARARHPEAVDA